MLIKIVFYLVVCPAVFAFLLGIMANVLQKIAGDDKKGSTLKETETAVKPISESA